MRNTYVNHKYKQKVRDFLINKFHFESVTGLAGPDINEYIEYMKMKGCKEFEIFENDPNILVSQLTSLDTDIPVSLKYDDIINADNEKPKTLFDLDFCVSIRFMEKYVRKFRDNFIMTFSLRPTGTVETIERFVKARGETLLLKRTYKSPQRYTLLKTNKGKYIYTSYRDTVPMCCIAKIN